MRREEVGGEEVGMKIIGSMTVYKKTLLFKVFTVLTHTHLYNDSL